MRALWRRFCALGLLLKIIWIFCLLGCLIDTWLIVRDLQHNGVLLQLHLGFWVLYAGQLVFILLHERMVFVLSLLQAFLALWTSLDFTFVPLARILGGFIMMFHGTLSLDQMEVYKYIFVSLCFTLELLKTALLWLLLPTHQVN